MTLARNIYHVTKASNSPFPIALREDGLLVSSVGVTRCDLIFKKPGAASVNVSSSEDSTWFDLQHETVIDGIDTQVIRVDLNDTALDPGRYEVDVYVFDAVNTDGIFTGTIDVEINAANPAAS